MRLLMLAAAIAVLLAMSGYLHGADASHTRARYCDAPCVVVLPPGTLEDEFWIDYGWHRLRDADGKVRKYPVVGVYARP